MKKTVKHSSVAIAIAVAAVAAFSGICNQGKKDSTSKTSEAAVVTNDNGSVSRTFTECTVVTNGNMVTEHRRETRTTLDDDGNMLETSTSEYAQSYPVGEERFSSFATKPCGKTKCAGVESCKSDSFLGLEFGKKFEGASFVTDASEPSLLRAEFKPAKPLGGFDDYFVYVTPLSHRIAKVYACAKKAVDPADDWRRHYLIEALEKRYGSWARPRSWRRPIYTFDIGSGRYVTACLSRASSDYETIVVAWDESVISAAQEESVKVRLEARKAAAEKRKAKVEDAASAF